MIKEIRERTTFDERSLMAPEPMQPVSAVVTNGHAAPQPAPEPAQAPAVPEPAVEVFSQAEYHEVNNGATAPAPNGEEDLSWDGILEDDLKTLRELIDKTKRTEDE